MGVFNQSAERLALAPVVCAANETVNGLTIDRRGSPYFRDLTFVMLAGEVTDGTHSLVIQESANGSAWTDVGDPAELAENTVTSSHYSGSQPYVRMAVVSEDVPDPDGVGGLFAGIVILSNPRHSPSR